MDLEPYMEKRLLYSTGMKLDTGWAGSNPRYWTNAASLDNQEISVGARILYEACLLPWTWRAARLEYNLELLAAPKRQPLIL